MFIYFCLEVLFLVFMKSKNKFGIGYEVIGYF